ncbi:MAG: peptidylprolyl isomerase [Spirochaetota bacterium]|nr:peptidylprolyl isomerase [Spirochaetota bacterium]
MSIAEAGKTVSVHYTGKLEDGTVFDSSIDREPLSFTVGAGQMIKGFDDGIVGMKVGEKKELVLQPEQAYGEHKVENIHEIDKNNIQNHEELTEGQSVTFNTQDGQPIGGTIKEIKDSTIVIDFNHFLAGKTLTFEVELVEVA